MTFALHVIFSRSPPLTCTHLVSPVHPSSCLLRCLSVATPPLPPPTADSLTTDWSFQVTSGLFPCLPNITGWPRPRNPAWAREGAEVHTHTNTHTCKKHACPQTQKGQTGAVLCSILSSIHFSSSSGYPWWCGCVRIHICQVCIRQSDE